MQLKLVCCECGLCQQRLLSISKRLAGHVNVKNESNKTTKSCLCLSVSLSRTLLLVSAVGYGYGTRHHQQNIIYETIFPLLTTVHTQICIRLLFSTIQMLANERGRTAIFRSSAFSSISQSLLPRT